LYKADPNFIRSKDSFGNTALIVAVQFGHLEILKWLIVQAPDILNEQNIGGDTGTSLSIFDVLLFFSYHVFKISPIQFHTK
jgi:ankyrin repeat protein